MTKGEAETIIECIRSLVDPGKARDVVAQSPDGTKLVKPGASPAPPPTIPRGSDVDLEKLYEAFKARLIDECRVDPILLALLTQRPEIVVEVEPRVITVDGTSMKGRVCRLIVAGFFNEPRATSAVRRELARIGADPGGGGGLSDVLLGLKRDGFLVDAGAGYKVAVGIKISEKELVAR